MSVVFKEYSVLLSYQIDINYLLPTVPLPPTPCFSNSNTRFGNYSYFYFNNGEYIVTGRVEVCPSIRHYTPVCMNAIDNKFAQLFCSRIAYRSGKNLT